MIEIIKHGKLKKGIAKCPNCGCAFSFDERDLEQTWDSNKGVLTCPECESTIKDWEWVDENHNETHNITELVDLEKEMTAYIERHFHIRYDETLEVGNDPLTTHDFEKIARYFYELGLKRKEE